MSKLQYKKIAFPHGGIVPAAFSRSETDERVGPHQAVDAEATYAQTLVDDRFAYFWTKKAEEEHRPAELGSRLVDNANAKAKSIIDAADAQAKKTVSEAEQKAKSIIEHAEAKAKDIADAADVQAKKAVSDAEQKALELVEQGEKAVGDAEKEAEKGGASDARSGGTGKDS